MKNLKIKKTYITKSNMTSGNTYRVTMSKDNKTIWFLFHDNYMNETDEKGLLECLYMDAMAYEYNDNMVNFFLEFGYEEDNIQEGKRAFYGCKKQYERLHKLFTHKEIEEMREAF
jgi:hypothetical protein